MKAENSVKESNVDRRGPLVRITLLLCLIAHPAVSGIFGGPTAKDLVGIWINTGNYKDTLQLFEDGDGRWGDGTFLEWKILDDVRVKIVSGGGDNKKVLIADTKDYSEKVLYVDNQEYLALEERYLATYKELAAAISAKEHAKGCEEGAVISASLRRGAEKAATNPRIRACADTLGGNVSGQFQESYLMEARELGADARGNLDKAISMSPDFGRSYIISAQCFDAEIAVLKMQARFATSMSMGQQEEYTEILSSLSTKAIAARVAAIERALSKNWRAQIFNALAWTHATTDDPDFLNGPLAVAYAKEAISLQPDQSVHLDTLAAAYARTDDFKEAVAVQKKAIALLPATQEANRPGYAERLAAYEQGQAYTAPK